MVGKDNLRAEDLNLCFKKLMMVAGSGNSEKGVNLKVGVITEWKDIPVELLMQILSLVDDQTVIIASGVCRGWRDAIYFGLARLSLSWYIVFSLDVLRILFCFSPIGDFVMVGVFLHKFCGFSIGDDHGGLNNESIQGSTTSKAKFESRFEIFCLSDSFLFLSNWGFCYGGSFLGSFCLFV